MEFARRFSAELLGESTDGTQRRALLYGVFFPPLSDTCDLIRHYSTMVDPDPLAVVFPDDEHAETVERVLTVYCANMDNVVLHRTSLGRDDFILRLCERVSRDGDAVVVLGCRKDEISKLRPYRATCEKLYPNLTVLDPLSTAYDGAAYSDADKQRALDDSELLMKMLPKTLTERERNLAASLISGSDGLA